MINIFSYNYLHDYSHFNSDESELSSAMDLEAGVETHSSQFIEKIAQHHTSTNSAILSSPLFKS